MTIFPKMEQKPKYSMMAETNKTLQLLLILASKQLPQELRPHIEAVNFTTSANTGTPYFPCPFKETEAISALKAVEAGVAAGIWALRTKQQPGRATVNLERASCFLFSAYLSTVRGLNKGDPRVRSYLKDTDLLKAQSILYRRLSANLYATKNPGEYFHLHGSLEATTALNMVGLEGHRPDMTNYNEIVRLIESHVQQFTVKELEEMNANRRQAGVTCLTWEQFKNTTHGRKLVEEPPFVVEALEDTSPPAPFADIKTHSPKPQILAGIKVLELCRVIAGPSIGRGLAEYGAQVLKVTSSKLSDVPFFQVDGNLGKHTTDLDLRCPQDRAVFEELLQSADVVLDGYRPGSLKKLGYGPEDIVNMTRHRGRGIIYVAEDCFGHVGDWAGRPGWQQIADCVTGVAWAQGRFMGLNEPVVPPFPMSDYGTGCIGTIAAMIGLYKRAKYGGSYYGKTSLCQYDIFLLKLGLYPDAVQNQLRRMHTKEFFDLRHHDSVDEVGKRALRTMRQAHPELFEEKYFHEAYSKGFSGPVKYVRPVAEIESTWNGFLRASRPNEFDPPSWDGWEVDKEMLKAY